MVERAGLVVLTALALAGNVHCGARAGLPGGALRGSGNAGGIANGGTPGASGGASANGGSAGAPGGASTGGEGGGAAGIGGTAGAGGVDACTEELGAPDRGWVRTWGGLGYDRARAVFSTGDAIFVAGSFNTTTDFDPGTSVDQHTASMRDLFLTQYDVDGTYRWTQTVGGALLGDGLELSSAAQGPNGSIVLATKFSGTLTTPGDDLVSADYGIAVLEFERDGSYAWGRSWPVHDFYASPSVAVDAGGSVFILGTFSGTTDFDPGPSVDAHDSTAAREFVEKLDRDGNHVWVRMPIQGDCFGGAITVDVNGSPRVAMSCTGTSGTSLSVAKLGTDGSTLAIASWNVEASAFALAPAPDGGVYLAGSARAGDLGPVHGLQDALLIALDAQGVSRWSRTWGGGNLDWNDLDAASAVTVDQCGSPIVAGIAANPFDVDPGSVEDVRAAGAYVSKFGPDGSLIWAKTWAGPPIGFAYTQASAVNSPSARELLVAGTFAGTVDFGLLGGHDPRTASGQEDAFLMRLEVPP